MSTEQIKKILSNIAKIIILIVFVPLALGYLMLSVAYNVWVRFIEEGFMA